jgi:hypothetical protein
VPDWLADVFDPSCHHTETRPVVPDRDHSSPLGCSPLSQRVPLDSRAGTTPHWSAAALYGPLPPFGDDGGTPPTPYSCRGDLYRPPSPSAVQRRPLDDAYRAQFQALASPPQTLPRRDHRWIPAIDDSRDDGALDRPRTPVSQYHQYNEFQSPGTTSFGPRSSPPVLLHPRPVHALATPVPRTVSENWSPPRRRLIDTTPFDLARAILLVTPITPCPLHPPPPRVLNTSRKRIGHGTPLGRRDDDKLAPTAIARLSRRPVPSPAASRGRRRGDHLAVCSSSSSSPETRWIVTPTAVAIAFCS